MKPNICPGNYAKGNVVISFSWLKKVDGKKKRVRMTKIIKMRATKMMVKNQIVRASYWYDEDIYDEVTIRGKLQNYKFVSTDRKKVI